VQPGERGLHRATGVLPAASEALQEHQTEGVDIGAGPDRMAADLRGGKVGGGLDHHSGAGDLRGVDHDGDAEVTEAGAAVLIE